MGQHAKTAKMMGPRARALAPVVRAFSWLVAFAVVTGAAVSWQRISPRAAEVLVAVSAAGALLAILVVALAYARRMRSAYRDPLRLARLVLVGESASLYRALGAGTDALGGRPSLLLVDGPQPGGKRLRRVRVIDGAEFDRALVRGRIDGAVLVPPISPGLANYVLLRCHAAGLPCGRVGELFPSLSALRAMLAESPGALLGEPHATRLPRDLCAPATDRPVDEMLAGQRVLVVGAGSPLGRQLALEVVRHAPGVLFLADGAGRDLDASERIAGALAVCDVEARLVDLRDPAAMSRLLATTRPSVVLHAAAPRRVVLAERHPAETALDILAGIQCLVAAAEHAGVERLLFISSLGAASPTSVVGALLRASELYLEGCAARVKPHLIALRLPCLLGAPGGVLHVFLDELERGLPITVAHPEVERRFVTLFEAARLVLRAAAAGKSGELYTAGTGAPVRILSLAERLIARAGLRTGIDVPIQFTGLGPGERLKEQMTFSEDFDEPSFPPSLRLAGEPPALLPHVGESIEAVVGAARAGRDERVVRLLHALVPDYRPAPEHRAGPHPDTEDDADDEDIAAGGPRTSHGHGHGLGRADAGAVSESASAMTVIAGGAGP